MPSPLTCPVCGGNKEHPQLIACIASSATEHHPLYGYRKPCPNELHAPTCPKRGSDDPHASIRHTLDGTPYRCKHRFHNRAFHNPTPDKDGGRCPDAAVCQSCPCAAEDDVCFPHERLAAERDHLRAEVERLRDALAEAANDLGKAANQFDGLMLSRRVPLDNGEIFADKERKARSALHPDTTPGGTT